MDRYDQLDDVLGTTAACFLGLTLRCARCHDHKFEPLKQTEYYRMLAVFEFTQRQARSFAGRLSSQAGPAAREQVGKAYELALCRPPNKGEWKAATDFLDAQQRQIEADTGRIGRASGEARKKALEAFCLVC